VTSGADGAPEAAGLNAAAATTGRSVLGGSAWSVTGKLLPQLYTLAISIAAARFLTSGEFGRQSFIAFCELSLVMLLTAGLPVGLMRYIGETLGRDQPAVVRGLIRWAWGVELVAAALGAGVLVVVALLGAEPTGAWALAGVACALGILHTVPSALLIGAQLWRSATIAGLVSGVVATVATIVVLTAGGGITGMFAVEAATSALVLTWTSLLARRAQIRLSPAVAPPGALRGAVTRWTLIASIGVFLNFIVWRRSELFFLNAFSSDSQIAVYSIAFALVTAMVRLPEALAEVSSPAIATLYGAAEHARIRSGYGRAARLVLIMAMPLTVAGFALGPSAIRTIWGEKYSDAGPLLLIMLSTFPLLPLFYLARGALVGIGRQKVLIAVSAVAGIVDIGLAAALVPAFDAVGAAIANAGAQVVAAVPIIVAARRIFGEIDWAPAALLRTAVASGVAGLAALGTMLAVGGVAGLLLGLGAGVAVFVLGAATLKILPAGDARWLAAAIGHIGGGRVGRAALLFARQP
jgi:O-antigen/teichoic acid export membrane protein